MAPKPAAWYPARVPISNTLAPTGKARAWVLLGGGALAALSLIGLALLRLRRLPVIG
jgi:hypothetical protein